MTTWFRIAVRLDPWSYRNLLRRTERLKKTNPKANPSVALRYTLRRIRD